MTEPLAPGERIDDLYRGGLKIIQNSSAPCFSIDAVLLADFASVDRVERIIDLGCGSGVISLLLARRAPLSRINGLELMEPMAELARRSVKLNGLEQRISIENGDIAAVEQIYGRAVADLVVTNPPYYQPGRGRESADILKAAARSERFCPLPLLLQQAAALLKPLGRLALVHRAERLADLLIIGEPMGLHAERLRLVQPRADRPANLLLLEYRKSGRGQLSVLPALSVYGSGQQYSAEMQAIYAGGEQGR